MSDNFRYITLFDNLGFESIIDITCDDAVRAEAVLYDEPDPLKGITSLVSSMTLRARFNLHRSPEIWVFWSDVDEDSLFKMAKENPQAMADLIRSKGVSVYKSIKTKRVIE